MCIVYQGKFDFARVQRLTNRWKRTFYRSVFVTFKRQRLCSLGTCVALYYWLRFSLILPAASASCSKVVATNWCGLAGRSRLLDDRGLKIRKVKASDEGTYVCRVQNRFGWQEAEATLTVHGQPALSTLQIVS